MKPNLHHAFAGLLLLGACGGDDTEPDPGPSYDVSTAIDEAILPSVMRFDGAVGALDAATDGFCEAADASSLETAQSAFAQTSLAWNRLVLYDFGPLRDDLILPSVIFVESMRQRGIDYTEDVREEIERALTSSVTLDAAYFDALRFNEVGLLAVEVLLFESSATDHSTGTQAVLADYQSRLRKCAYLEGIVARLRDRAESIRSGWLEGFDGGAPYAERFREGPLADGSDPAALLVTKVFEHIDYVVRRKLEGILDARLSGLTYANIGATLEEHEVLLEGAGGMLDVMLERGTEPQIVEAIRATLAASLEAAASEDRGGLILGLGALDADFRTTIPARLGIDLSLSFADGD